jgi:TonB family protein
VDQKDEAANQALSNSIPSSVPAKVMQERVITKLPPVYPPEAKKAHIQGKVILEAVIGTDGHVLNTKVLSGPGALQASAQDAVRQWVYKPYLVNGAPVEVTTKVTVKYTLSK